MVTDCAGGGGDCGGEAGGCGGDTGGGGDGALCTVRRTVRPSTRMTVTPRRMDKSERDRLGALPDRQGIALHLFAEVARMFPDAARFPGNAHSCAFS